MTTITISLSDERLERLKALAQKSGISPEDLARLGLEEWLEIARRNEETYQQCVVKDQARFEQEMALNRKAYEELKEEIRQKYSGQYVGIAHGRLIAAGPSFDEVSTAVLAVQPRPEHVAVFLAGTDPGFEVYDSISTEFF